MSRYTISICSPRIHKARLTVANTDERCIESGVKLTGPRVLMTGAVQCSGPFIVGSTGDGAEAHQQPKMLSVYAGH